MKSHKLRTRIQLDANKWEDIQERIPGIDLNTTIDKFINTLLNKLIERGVDLDSLIDDATEETLEEL
jgi:hypothetical protein